MQSRKTTTTRNKSTVFVLCIGLVFVNLGFKLLATPAWFDGTLVENHARLLEFSYTNHEQSRPLQYYIPEAIVWLTGLNTEWAYIVQRFTFTLATYFLFFIYARKWFEDRHAFACVAIMAFLMLFTYRDHLQESAPLLSLTFLGVFWALRERNTLLYVIILVFGSLNNETILFTPVVYFFLNYDPKRQHDLWRQGARTILLAAPACAVFGAIRWYTRDRPVLGGPIHLWENLYEIESLLMVFNVFWVLAFLRFKDKPFFLRRTLLTIPLFIVPHIIFGAIRETRQMIPLSFILIPASVFWWIQWRQKKKQ